MPHQTEFLQLSRECILVVGGIGHLRWLKAVTGGRIESDVANGIHEARAKADRGDVSLTRGAKAENKPQRAAWQVRLIRVRDDRRVEQRRGFKRVLMREVCAQQQFPFLRNRLVSREKGANLLEPPAKELADLEMAFCKFGLHF